MTGFEDREKGYEGKFAHQERLGFDLAARCAKIFGLWAADKIGLEGDDANTYAISVVEANLEEAGFEDIIRKVKADLEEKGIEMSDHMIRVELDKALTQAQSGD